ncbi:metallophosphoesterase [bacterium LRH843]|nr:metallophosphoesterase [bacterium LRH843]
MKITAMGDLHYVQDRNYSDGSLISEKFTEARDHFFNEYIKNFFSVESNYYVSIGDLTNFGTVQELTEVYEKINSYNKPFFHTIGNHDLYSMSREQVSQLINQKINHSVDFDEVKLIFWETAREMDYEVYGGIVSEEQLTWLQKELEESGDKTVILFGHHPIYDTTIRSNYKNLSIDPEMDVYSVLKSKKSGKGIYVCGHNHFDSIVEKDNWTFVQIAAVLDVPSVRMFEIEEDKVTISSQTILADSYLEEAKYIGEQMDHFNNIWDGEGTTLARNVVVNLSKELVVK